ncbi:hypothetical protein F53441_2149 [Fusarium austroafricanum]|uniref:Altered inheritance of mitochondria protein 21 n=1 Tax=Fusarium austroafricanum TaxID=2364996 RepID=A0A8H4KS06_9HYPO|nr:hypothetical protein F53441_2149 [Fusarium austroafricanum]
MTATAMQQPPVIPPRPAKGQDKSDSPANAPKIPPRPSTKRFDRSISPNPDRFAPSPFNEGIPQKSPISARFNPNDAQQEPINRPTSVSMPSIGQEGAEYSAVTHEVKPEEVEATEETRAASPEQTRTIAEDLKLHAPKPSLPAHSAKQRVQAVTRTDSDKAAQFGIGRPGSTQGNKKQSSTNISVSDGRPEIEDEHGIPEIGQRVPMNPHLGDVQAPSPGPGSEEFKKHHHRKHSSRGGPPGSYGLHGHGVAPQDKLEKEYYEKHPEALKREHQTPLHDRQNDFAMSKDDLNKLVRDTRSRGAGLGTSGYQSTPTDEVGFQASEEYTSRLSPRPDSASASKAQPLSFKSEITSPEGEQTVHVDDPQHPEYRSYGNEDHAVDDEDHEYTAPILAADEVKNDDHPYSQHPAVHPPPDRRGSADLEEPTSRPLSRSSRPKSRPTSIYKNNDSQEFAPTSLDDVEEYEPLFPEDGKKEAQKPAPGNKARHHFPSKDIWEDAPDSVHYTVEVSTPDQVDQTEPTEELRRGLSAMDRPKTPAHIFAQRQEELAEQEANGPVDTQPPKSHDNPIWYESKDSDSFLNDNKRPSASQRFPSKDIWEDAPESQLYETTISDSPPVESKEESKEQSKPAIPERPARKASEDRPAIPERPKPKHTPSDEGKSRPPASEKPKPQIPPRPTKSSSGDSTEVKQKPPVPTRPAGSKIAALQAGFMSDLNKRLKLGPQAPKKEEPKPEEDMKEEREKVPLSDARKGRARGPQRRAPAKSPAAVPAPAVQPSGPFLTFLVPQTLWSIDPEGSLSVSGEQTPVSEPEPVVEKTEEPVDEPTAPQEPLPKSEPNLEPKPELRSEPESESVPMHRDPEPAAGKLPQEAEPELPAQHPAVEPAPKPAQEASSEEPVQEQEPIQVEKSLVTNTAGESILETTLDKKEGGDTVEPVGVSDEVKQ